MASYKIYLSPPSLSGKEHKALKAVIKSNWLAPHGEQSSHFRTAIRHKASTKYVVLTNSATAAIHLALKVLDVSIGDEVICPSYTFGASAFPILYQNAKPVFVDVKADTWNICPDLLEIAIKDRIRKRKKIKAIILVHNYGNPVAWNKIQELASNYEIPIIEDAAEALGAVYHHKKVGGLSDLGVYSFNANKIITTSGGGSLLCKKEADYAHALKLSNQAKEPQLAYYQHEHVGFNYTMSDVQAAIGIGQLNEIEKRVAKKRKIFQTYQNALEAFDFISFQKEEEHGYSNRWLSCIRLSEKAPKNALTIKNILQKDKIETRLSWNPLHLQKAFHPSENYTDGTSEKLFQSVLCLPSGIGLTKRDQQYVIKKLKESFK